MKTTPPASSAKSAVPHPPRFLSVPVRARPCSLAAAALLLFPIVALSSDPRAFTNWATTARATLSDTAARLDALAIPCHLADTWTTYATAAITASHDPAAWRAIAAKNKNTRDPAQAAIRSTLTPASIDSEVSAFYLRTRRHLSTLTPSELLALRAHSTPYRTPARP